MELKTLQTMAAVVLNNEAASKLIRFERVNDGDAVTIDRKALDLPRVGPKGLNALAELLKENGLALYIKYPASGQKLARVEGDVDCLGGVAALIIPYRVSSADGCVTRQVIRSVARTVSSLGVPVMVKL